MSAYQNYIVAFIDILGFKNIVERSEKSEHDFLLIHKVLNHFTSLKHKETWEQAHILMDVEEDAQKKELNDFYIDDMVHCCCFSDSVIIAIEASESINERCSALIALLAQISTELLKDGILIRGAISYGGLYVDSISDTYFGTALNKSYTLENTVAKYPRIILSKELISRLNYPLLAKRDRMPYHQYIERFSDGTVGFSPLIYLQVMESVPDILQENKLKNILNDVKLTIMKGLDDNFESPSIYEKYFWLLERYNELIIFNVDKGQIYTTDISDSRHNIHFTAVNEYCKK